MTKKFYNTDNHSSVPIILSILNKDRTFLYDGVRFNGTEICFKERGGNRKNSISLMLNAVITFAVVLLAVLNRLCCRVQHVVVVVDRGDVSNAWCCGGYSAEVAVVYPAYLKLFNKEIVWQVGKI